LRERFPSAILIAWFGAEFSSSLMLRAEDANFVILSVYPTVNR